MVQFSFRWSVVVDTLDHVETTNALLTIGHHDDDDDDASAEKYKTALQTRYNNNNNNNNMLRCYVMPMRKH